MGKKKKELTSDQIDERKKRKDAYKLKMQQELLKVQNAITTNTNSIDLSFFEGEYMNKLNSIVQNGLLLQKSKKYNVIPSYLDLEEDDLLLGKKIDDTYVQTIKKKLNPTYTQQRIMIMWSNLYIDMYNKVIELINGGKKEECKKENKFIHYNEMKTTYNLNDLKKTFSEFKHELQEKKIQIGSKIVPNNINLHILDYAILDAIAMFNSVVSNLENGHFKKAKLRRIKKTKQKKYFKIENLICKEKGFAFSVLGKMKATPEIANYKEEITKTSIVQYDSKKHEFKLLIKVPLLSKEESKKILENRKNKIKQPVTNQKIISIDPGLRTLLTCLTNEGIVEIGSTISEHLKKYIIKIDNITNNNYITDKRKKRAINKYNNYMKNYINDQHWKIANYLTTHHNHILIGNLSTKGICKSETLNGVMKRVAMRIGLYQLREKIKYKCLVRNKKYKLVNEKHTTQCCSNCGNQNKNVGSSKIYSCTECKKQYDRDVNSTKDIALKSIKIKK